MAETSPEPGKYDTDGLIAATMRHYANNGLFPFEALGHVQKWTPEEKAAHDKTMRRYRRKQWWLKVKSIRFVATYTMHDDC